MPKLELTEEGTKIMILSPLVEGEKGTHIDLLDSLRRDGYSRVKINGEVVEQKAHFENRQLSQEEKNLRIKADISYCDSE